MVLRIDLCNRAMTGMGLDPIQTETSDGADTVLNIYDEVLEDFLSRFDWHFAISVRQLGRLDEVPNAGWNYAFELPPERLGPPKANYSDKKLDNLVLVYELAGTRFMANEEEIFSRFTIYPDPLSMPGYFRRVVVLGIKAELASAVLEDDRKQALLERKLFGPPSEDGNGGFFGNAMTLDSQAKPSPVLKQQPGSLVSARWK